MDLGRAIDVGEAAARCGGSGGGEGLPKELECILRGMSCIFCT